VIERVIKQPKAEQPVEQPQPTQGVVDQFKELISVMTDAGMINTSTEPEQPQPLTAEVIGEVLATYLGNGTSEQDDGKYAGVVAEVKTLREDLAKREKNEMQSQIDQLKGEVGKPRNDLSDTQFSENIRKDIEDARIEAIKEVGDSLVKPLFEMQATQSKFQTLLTVRELERQDKTAPGTYTQMFSGNSVSDEAIQGDLSKWRDRASKVGASG